MGSLTEGQLAKDVANLAGDSGVSDQCLEMVGENRDPVDQLLCSSPANTVDWWTMVLGLGH